MKKRLIAFALVVAMIMGGLTGCGNPEVANDSVETTEEVTEVAGSANKENNKGKSSMPEVQMVPQEVVENFLDETTGTIELTVWASEAQQEFTQSLIDKFIYKYPYIDLVITLGALSESNARSVVLTDVEAAADVYTFADDQIGELVNAGALQPILASYTYDVLHANLPGAINAATVDGTLYAYPSTASNGYFMFYSKEYFTQEDVKTMDGMLKIASDNGKKISMDVANGWYLYSFFKGAGLDAGLNDDLKTNYCDWNKEGGVDVVESILSICENPGFQATRSDEFQTGIADGTIIAGVSGTWDAEAARAAWGNNYAAAKLPTYTLDGEQVQMASFSGYKLIGVNPHSKNIGWALLLAEYLTNESSQLARYEATSEGPSNIEAAKSNDVLRNPAISALAAQSDYAVPQRIGGKYWSPTETLGSILAGGNAKGEDIQKLLDSAVDGITAPEE